MKINKNGFNNVNIENIDIEKINYNDDLIFQINNELIISGYNLHNINYYITRNKIQITMDDDLYRNGEYTFIIQNKNNTNDIININISITNSLYLSDNFKITYIGEIYDYRPKTIIMNLLIYNMNMIKYLPKIANELMDKKNYIYNINNINNNNNIKQVILKINDIIPNLGNKPKQFYGQLNLSFIISSFTEKFNYLQGVTMEELFKINRINDNQIMKTELGKLNYIDKYTILMTFIQENLPYSSKYWSLFINDLDLENFEIKKDNIYENKYTIAFYTKQYSNLPLSNNPIEQNNDIYAHFINIPKDKPIILSFFYTP